MPRKNKQALIVPSETYQIYIARLKIKIITM